MVTELTLPQPSILEKYKAYTPKPTHQAELKPVLMLKAIWKDFPQNTLNHTGLAFRKRLQACPPDR